ncbi:hypothetical protein GP486_003490 [Trichoglossum hirsutum]|uniref:FluG domain-containing protein n=1 Tax=Trichoglossum hirsutum TaxID=265104 RepID=A0A9P8LCI1_9PEZI|nr:hypothetical protein GP486_003490 [Trichoglossum hirsutum]
MPVETNYNCEHSRPYDVSTTAVFNNAALAQHVDESVDLQRSDHADGTWLSPDIYHRLKPFNPFHLLTEEDSNGCGLTSHMHLSRRSPHCEAGRDRSQMSSSRPRLPRRHIQRQALHSARNVAPQKLRTGRNNKLDSSLDTDFVSNLERDSKYSSHSNLEDEARYYDQMMEKFEEEGPTLSNPGESTLDMMRAEKRQWKKFCKTMGIHAKQALIACEAKRFKAYLIWRIDHSRVKKESTIITYWKVLSMVYARSACRYMDEGILYDIKNIPSYLTPQFGLDDSEKEKACLFVDDLSVLLNCHWVRDTEIFAHERLHVQMAFLLLVSGCTATRPGALVGKRPLLYSDIKLFLVQGEEQVPTIAMRLSLKHIKRSGRKSRDRKDFTFYEGADLVICPIIPFLALAFVDDAFEANIATPTKIYDLVIPDRKTRIHLKWKTEWAERSIFRDVEATSSGVRISETKHLQYSKHRHHFIRLGRACGFEKVLQFYDLRRASGKKITEALTPEECNQIMGHRHRGTYIRYYMSGFIDRDCQAIYLGSPSRDDLVRAVGRLTRDALAPTTLTDTQKLEISNDPKLLELCRRRQCYADKIKEDLGFPTIKAAEGTKWYLRHKSIQADINNLKRQLSDTRLSQAIQEFHDTVDTIEINNQLQGIMPTEVLAPSTIKYELKERSIAAKLFFEPLDNLDESQVFRIRARLIRNLTRLCKRQETPRSYKKAIPRKRQCTLYEDEHIEAVQKPKKIPRIDSTITESRELSEGDTLCCPFCRCDEEAGLQKRNFLFARIDGLRKHIQEQHLNLRAPGEGLVCPFQGCSAVLVGTMHFLNHSKHQHKLCLW